MASGAMGPKDVGSRTALPEDGPVVLRVEPGTTLSHGTASRRVPEEVPVVPSGRVQTKLRKVRAKSTVPLFPEKTEAQLRRENRELMDRLDADIVELKESDAKLRDRLDADIAKLRESDTKLRESDAKLRNLLDADIFKLKESDANLKEMISNLKEKVENHGVSIGTLEAALLGS